MDEREAMKQLSVRSSSLSSTSSLKSRMTSQSVSSSGCYPASTQQICPPHHLNHVLSCVAADAADLPAPIIPCASSFLQDRLQQERGAARRSLAKSTTERMRATLDPRAVQSSPINSLAESWRPRSNMGDDLAQIAGTGLLDMRQKLDTLHKQNFDLKAELFHRREKQNELEERLEKLERDAAERVEINERLLAELEKRDEAVREAVGVILDLEAREERLLRERQMVQQIEAEGYPDRRLTSPGRSSESSQPHVELTTTKEGKSINRTPSLQSEKSESTADLRNAYLGASCSFHSLPRSDSQGLDRDFLCGAKSPNLSILSESSFLSVYGQLKSRDSPSPFKLEPTAVDGPAKCRAASKTLGSPSGISILTSSQGRPGPSADSIKSAQFRKLNPVSQGHASSLHRVEQIDSEATRNESPSSTSSRPRSVPSRKSKSPPTRTKQEKREAWDRVLTNGPLRDLRQHGTLPPTPDTISTSTLRRWKKSDEVMSNDDSPSARQGSSGSGDTGASVAVKSRDVEKETHLGKQPSRAPSTSAFNGKKQVTEKSNSLGVCFSFLQPPRPRSADESIVSRKRGLAPWDDESSEEECLDGDESVASSFDYWIHDGFEKNGRHMLDPLSSVSQTRLGGQELQRPSPDLFAFPTNCRGWDTRAMFGARGARGAQHEGKTPVPTAQTLDALGNSLPAPTLKSLPMDALFDGNKLAPPAPSRRSSLAAAAGSTSSSLPKAPSASRGKSKTSPLGPRRMRSNSIDVQCSLPIPNLMGFDQQRSSTVPPRQIFASPAPPTSNGPVQTPKQRHYPPTSGQGLRSRGISLLFRRSVDPASGTASMVSASAPAAETAFQHVIGVPSWGKRSSADDERTRATPPPIMRDRGEGGAVWDSVEDGGGGALLDSSGGDVSVGVVPGQGQAAQPAPPGTSGSAGSGGGGVSMAGPATATSGKKKWLGSLARVGSLRHRAS